MMSDSSKRLNELPSELDEPQSDELLPHRDPPLPSLFSWQLVTPADNERLERFLAGAYVDNSFAAAGSVTKIRLRFHFPAAFLSYLFDQNASTRLLYTCNDEWLGHFAGYSMTLMREHQSATWWNPLEVKHESASDDMEVIPPTFGEYVYTQALAASNAQSAHPTQPTQPPTRTLIATFLAVAPRRRHKGAAKRLFDHLFAVARANHHTHALFSFSVDCGTTRHVLEYVDAEPARWALPGRAAAIFQITLWYVQLSNRLRRFEVVGDVPTHSEPPATFPLTESNVNSVARLLYERRMPAGSLHQQWETLNDAKTWLHHLISNRIVHSIVCHVQGVPVLLAVIYSGPSDIYVSASTARGLCEVDSGEQLNAAYFMYLEPLVSPDDFLLETRRAVAHDLAKTCAGLGYDALFLPELGTLAGVGGAVGYPATHTVDQRYFWLRIGEPGPNMPGSDCDPSLLHILSV